MKMKMIALVVFDVSYLMSRLTDADACVPDVYISQAPSLYK